MLVLGVHRGKERIRRSLELTREFLAGEHAHARRRRLHPGKGAQRRVFADVLRHTFEHIVGARSRIFSLGDIQIDGRARFRHLHPSHAAFIIRALVTDDALWQQIVHRPACRDEG